MDMFASLRAFVAVVEDGGFTPAARRAGQAASSFTRHVDALEKALGVALLNRSTRLVTLTSAGESYFPQAIRILEALNEANRSVREGDSARGLLRISLPVTFARLHVTPFLPRFMAEYSDIELDVFVSDEIVNLVERRIDVAIRLGALDASDLIARRLAPQRRVVCASPAYLGARGVPKTPAELAAHDCLVFSFANGERRWRFTRGEQEELVRVKGRLRANQADALKEAALEGYGLAMLPTWLVGDEIAQGRLRPVLSDWRAEISRTSGSATGEAAVHAVYPPDRRQMAKVRVFVDFLASRFGAPPYWDRAV